MTITENVSEAPSAVPAITTLDDQTVCLFSNHKSETIEDNLKYMENNYGFFIIEAKSCVNKKGLLKYLGRLVHKKFKCITCDKTFKSGRDTQNHMIDT